jgi:hypothetical protein
MGLFAREKDYTLQIVRRHQARPQTLLLRASSPAAALTSEQAAKSFFSSAGIYREEGNEFNAGPLRSILITDGENRIQYDNDLADEITLCVEKINWSESRAATRKNAQRLDDVLKGKVETYRQPCEVELRDGTTLAYDVLVIDRGPSPSHDEQRLYQLAAPLTPEQRNEVASLKLGAVAGRALGLECTDPEQATRVLFRSWNGVTPGTVNLMFPRPGLKTLSVPGLPALSKLDELALGDAFPRPRASLPDSSATQAL